jgi:chitinase
MIKTLRRHFGGAKKPYLITGAPQCVVPDANMGQMISQAQFDIIWVQYYNTPQCSARTWVTANPNYTRTGIEEPSGFSFDAWERFLVGTASSNAKLYIGLPGGPGFGTFYLSPTEASSLIRAYYCKPNFGGILIWEATAAENNDVGCGETYYEAVKGILVADSLDGTLDCVVPPASLPPTSSTSICTVTSTTTTSVSSTITPTPPCTEVYVVVSGDYCYAIWTEFGITEAQLYAWNPTLDANCDLSIGQVLCVAESTSTTTSVVSTTTTSNSTSATATACTEHYTVVSGDTCYAIWTEFGITEAQLYAFNPTLDTNCDLSIGQVLCVSESPTSTSSSLSITRTSTTASVSATPSACTKYYTVVSGDYCSLIWTEFEITEAQLYAYNPTLDTNCDLSIGQVLCVSETPTSTSNTISTTSSATRSSTSPSSTATCTEYYTVVSGDYCYLIYTEFGITEAQLYAYNPSLDTNCDLSIGQVLCVSESPLSSSSSSVTSTSSSKSGTSSKRSTTSTSTSKISTGSSSKSTSTSSSSRSITTSSSIHLTTYSTTSSVPATTPLICNSDNCLRQLQHSSASAAAFCATYTKTINTASTGLPTSVSNCQSSYVRISSACSCLVSSSSTTTTTRSTSATQTTASTKTNDSSVVTSTTRSTSATPTSSTKTNDSSVITSSTGTTLKTSTSKSSSSSTISASFTP